LKLKQYSKISLGVNSRVRGLQYAYSTTTILDLLMSTMNEKLFYQNTAVLLKIVQMLQDIKLKSEADSTEEHQFLGDMFEGFLDQGVKQSEGQFFTPMPIVKFILKSLPLESIITCLSENSIIYQNMFFRHILRSKSM
jgi:type I restriction-modification system DNA methylase subunit